MAAAFLALLAFTPLPTLPLLITSGGIAGLAFGLVRTAKTKVESQKTAATSAASATKAEPDSPESMLELDAMELEVGYGLVSLVDTHQGGDLLERISMIRRQIAADLGIIVPPVRIRDNLQLAAHEYRLKIKGAVVARGMTIPGQLLAMDSGISSGTLDGTPPRSPPSASTRGGSTRARRPAPRR